MEIPSETSAKLKILMLCAHPDDLEFSIPSLLISLAANPNLSLVSVNESKISKALEKSKEYIKKSTQLLVCSTTRGEMSDFSLITLSTKKAALIRTSELNRSQKILTGKTPDYFGEFDGYIRLSDRYLNELKNYIKKLKPDIVIAPEPVFAWYHHQDHVRVGKAAFYAIRRLFNEYKQYNKQYKDANYKKEGENYNQKSEKNAMKKVPHLYYFQSIVNDWYFPRFKEFKPLIKEAIKSHRSQAGLLILAKIPGFFEALLHGLHTRNSTFGEALRIQPIFRSEKFTKKFSDLPFLKRIIWYLSKSILGMHYDYSERYKLSFDGRLPPKRSSEFR